MPIQETIREKREQISQVAKSHGANRVRLFGSAARGEAGPNSDVDVLVNMEPGRSLLDIIAIKQDMEDLLGREVHVVTEASVSPYIRDEVLKEAINL